MTVKALVIYPDGTAALGDIEPDLKTLKKIVGGWLEVLVPSTDEFGDWHAYINEEGKIEGLPLNLPATAFAESIGWAATDFLVGPVVFLGSGGEGEDAGAEEADVPDLVVRAAQAASGQII